MIEFDPFIQRCLLVGFALLYATSAWHKASNRIVFSAVLENYRVLPKGLSGAATIGLIIAEAATALLLLSPAYSLGILMGIALQVGYFSGITINLVRGRIHIDCGCMGSDGDGISSYHAARNLVLIALLVLAALPTYSREIIWLDALLMLLVVGSGIVAYGAVNKLLLNHTRQGAWR